MRILWVDDEIEEFKSHLLFLESEGIDVKTASSGPEALEALKRERFDLVLLDYRMPGMDGLQALGEIRKIAPHVPVVMVTMMTDKEVMEEAVAQDVYEFLVKPIQPSQIVAIVKRLQGDQIKRRRLGRKLSELYARLASMGSEPKDWMAKARLLMTERMELWGDEREALEEEMRAQNESFARWVQRNYPSLLRSGLTMSHNLLERKVFPALREGQGAVLFLIDCFRLDQFQVLIEGLSTELRIKYEDYMTILPSATQFARNSIFAGALPAEIHRKHRGWLRDNQHEPELLEENLARHGLRVQFAYKKLNTFQALRELEIGQEPLQVYIINFVDIMFHLRHELDVLRALGDTVDSLIHWGEFLIKESGLRFKVLEAAREGYRVFLTSDHGWVMGLEPLQIHGGGELTPGLRYKFGDSVRALGKGGMLVKELAEWGLPAERGARRLLLATGYRFLVFSSDPHRFERTYKGGVFHGGVSLEEMVVPVIEASAS